MLSVKKIRRTNILAILFILIISSNGFGSKTAASPENLPVYEEQTLGEGFINNPGPIIRLNSKNQLVVYGARCYSIMDLNGMPIRQIKTDFAGNGWVFALDSKDNIYALAQDKGAPDVLRTLYVFSPKGEKLKMIDLGKAPVNNGLPETIQDMAVDSKGNVYFVIYEHGIVVLRRDTKSLKDFRNGSYHSITLDTEDNLIVKGDNNTYEPIMEKIKATNGETIWKIKFGYGNWIYRIFYNVTDRFIYALGKKQVVKFNSSGKSGGVVLDLFENNLVKEDILEVGGLVVDPSMNIYLVARKAKDGSIKKFRPIPGVIGSKEQKVITIAVPINLGNFLETICSSFREKHPDYRVDIKTYVYGDNQQAHEDYMKILNTEIITGKGADIIGVYKVPYLKYIDKNFFVNLSELIAKDKGLNPNLDPRILEACKYKGKLCVLPANIFWMPVIFANQTLLERAGISINERQWTWQDFYAIAQKLTRDTDNDGIIDQYALYEMDPKTLFNNYMFQEDRFIDYEQKNARFDSPEFRDLLTLCKSISGKKLMKPSVDVMKFVNGQSRGSIALAPMFLDSYGIGAGRREQFESKSTRIGVYSLPGLDQGVFFSTRMLYAINNNSRFKNEAWELLKTMLSEDMQNNPENNGIPVSLKAREAKAKEQLGVNINGSQALTIEERQQIDGLLGRINKYQYSDPQILKLVNDETTKFFDGEKTAEEVGRIIQSKVETYLNE